MGWGSDGKYWWKVWSWRTTKNRIQQENGWLYWGPWQMPHQVFNYIFYLSIPLYSWHVSTVTPFYKWKDWAQRSSMACWGGRVAIRKQVWRISWPGFSFYPIEPWAVTHLLFLCKVSWDTWWAVPGPSSASPCNPHILAIQKQRSNALSFLTKPPLARGQLTISCAFRHSAMGQQE